MTAILSASEMPVSFTGQALFFAARTKWLNFRTDGIPDHPGWLDVCVLFGRGCSKGSALIVYSIATAILCAPLGVLYHAASALRQKAIAHLSAPNARAHADALAWEHFKAMLTDVSGIALSVFGGLYALGYAVAPNAAIGWWFSSTHVRTGYNDPPLVQNDDERIRSTTSKFHWGKEEASTEQCSYQKMRISAVRQWENEGEILPLNDPQVLSGICVRGFKLSTDKTIYSNEFAAQPTFHSERYVCMKGANQPAYQMHWKTALKIIGLAALAILYVGCGIWVATSVLLPLFTANLVGSVDLASRLFAMPGVFTLIAFLFQNGILAYRHAAKWLNKARAPAEIALSYQLTKKNLPNPQKEKPIPPAEALKNGGEALFWLKAAAHRGNSEAQRELGLCLLGAILRKESAAEKENFEQFQKEKIDQVSVIGRNRALTELAQYRIRHTLSEDLPMIREALSWLQAAAINGDNQAVEIILELLYHSPDRYFRGISGDTEEERMRSLLEGFGLDGYDEAIAAFQRVHSPNNNPPDQKPDILDVNARTEISKAIAESRKQLYVLAIKGQAPGPLDSLKPLYEIVADYLVGSDSQPLFFPSTPSEPPLVPRPA